MTDHIYSMDIVQGPRNDPKQTEVDVSPASSDLRASPMLLKSLSQLADKDWEKIKALSSAVPPCDKDVAEIFKENLGSQTYAQFYVELRNKVISLVETENPNLAGKLKFTISPLMRGAGDGSFYITIDDPSQNDFTETRGLILKAIPSLGVTINNGNAKTNLDKSHAAFQHPALEILDNNRLDLINDKTGVCASSIKDTLSAIFRLSEKDLKMIFKEEELPSGEDSKFTAELSNKDHIFFSATCIGKSGSFEINREKTIVDLKVKPFLTSPNLEAKNNVSADMLVMFGVTTTEGVLRLPNGIQLGLSQIAPGSSVAFDKAKNAIIMNLNIINPARPYEPSGTNEAAIITKKFAVSTDLFVSEIK